MSEIARVPRPTIKSPRRDVLIKVVTSRGKFADARLVDKNGVRVVAIVTGLLRTCCNLMSLDGMLLVGEIARTLRRSPRIALRHFSSAVVVPK